MTAKERHYKLLIGRGFKHEDAERLAHGKFQANIQTDATFAAGLDKVGVMADPSTRKHHLDKANAAGVSTAGKVYMSQLASEPGDPRAWVSQMDAKSEIKKRCIDKGWGCEGGVSVPVPTDEPPLDETPFLADDIVQDAADEYVAELGEDVSPKERLEIEDKIREERTPTVGQSEKTKRIFDD